MTKFLIVFITVLFVLFGIEMQQTVQMHVVQPFTAVLADISAALIMPFDDAVTATGRIIRHTENQFAVSIEAGCNGVEAAIVLIAAVVAFPARPLQKAAAILAGFLAIQAMNILRIISLFYLGQWRMDVFSWSHLYLWPVLIMLDVLIVFLLYLRYIARVNVQPAVSA
ncbi:exosortase H [Chromatocurvus halotolerans]|uniref:Exosortase H (IPTLxxWG-CTERM-specific) n=1 Tax=Chromatocurvus halotolerans TaxID=1132028 RepID=A0A4R2L943_9GAMM|nr:exosortase H [Chromatocurvus halotolerans]TCO75745.1 exosortase H (IPTLxxWG-CTERM-specific) [Chromatocurvus halotolerans]